MSCKADVLVVTVTQEESRAVLKAFEQVAGRKAEPQPIDERMYFDFGTINGAHVWMTQSEMGSGGLDASLLTVLKGIESLSPAAVIMIGIAFGVNDRKQAIGDILVTENLRPYELQRVGTRARKPQIVLRGDRPHASPWFLNHLKSAELSWQGAQVRFGVLLTGEKLVDNVDFREQLRTFEPEAIGGEMEGAGLYVACQNKKIDWILVKAICDWADGHKARNKHARQQTAAQNAAAFVLHALKFAPIDWANKRHQAPQPAGTVSNIIISPSPGASKPSPAVHSSLPAPPADFTGRQEQIDELVRQLSAGTGAAISGLAGMGGIGKTALALKVAHSISPQYADAQIYVDLKGTSSTPLSPTEVMVHVIRAFDPLMDLRQATKAEIAATYCTLLTNKRALLLLDNAADAAQVKPLIPPASCSLLVTSRRYFTLPGLTPLRLDLLPVVQACELVLKICPRIGAQVADIAKACGYLPLALRIAASTLAEHVDVSAQEYLQKLADRRQRIDVLKSASDPELDLRATFDYSYALLSTQLRAYWRQLSVFPAPFDATAAAAIWGIEQEPALNALSHFVRVSLLDYDEQARRYSMHDLLASFAEACLGAEERMSAQQRHAEHYVRVAASADALYLQGGESVLAGLELFDAEWSHIRAGQAWATANAQTKEAAAQLCNSYPNAAVYCLSLRLHPREQIHWLQAAATAAHRLKDRRGEGNHLGNLGLAYFMFGEVQKAIGYHEQALAVSREIGDKRGEGADLGNLGNAYANLGEVQKAIGYHEQALAISREMGDRSGEGNDLGNLGNAYARLGEVRKAIGYHEQALAIHREIGDRRGEANDLVGLGLAYADRGELKKAIRYHEQALAISREIGDRRGEGNDLGNLGNAYADLGEVQKAIGYYEQALIIAREIGDKRGEGNRLGNLGNAYADLGEVQKGIGYYEQALAIAREIGDKRGEGNRLGGLGIAYAKLGEVQKAIRYYEQALAISREIGDRRGEGARLFNLSIALERLGDVPNAISYTEAAWKIYVSIEAPEATKARQRLERLKSSKKSNPEQDQLRE